MYSLIDFQIACQSRLSFVQSHLGLIKQKRCLQTHVQIILLIRTVSQVRLYLVDTLSNGTDVPEQNILEPDQTPRNTVYGLGFHCLLYSSSRFRTEQKLIDLSIILLIVIQTYSKINNMKYGNRHVYITKTRVFKYIENFITKNWKFSDKNSDIFHISAQNIDVGTR